MENVKYAITLDVKKPGTQNTIYVRKTDTLTRELNITFVAGGKPFNFAADTNALIKIKKPDSTQLYNHCTIEGNTVNCVLTTQALLLEGTVECEVVLYTAGNETSIVTDGDITIKGGKVLTSPRFNIIVENHLFDDKAAESSNEYSALIEALATANAYTIKNIKVVDGYLIIEYNSGLVFSYYVQGPKGEKGESIVGPAGKDGNPGVYVGSEEPGDDYDVWIDESDTYDRLFPEYMQMTAADTVVDMKPNKLYVFPTMANLKITLATPDDNTVANEYHFMFQSGNTATKLTLPNNVVVGTFTVDPNTYYEVSILNGFLAYQSW